MVGHVLVEIEDMVKKLYPCARIFRHGGELFIHDGLTVQVECKLLECLKIENEMHELKKRIENLLKNYNSEVTVLQYVTPFLRKYIVELNVTIYKR